MSKGARHDASADVDGSLILNVDDHAPTLYARHRLLALNGFDVVNASTGQQAVSVARERRPNLILLDIHLPDSDGRALCQQIKGDPELRHIPVVLISSTLTSHAQQLEGVRWAGADGFVREPIEPDALISTLRRILRAA